jgi:formate hydrogenlyase subunit 6/NADH:ubiquinone oxidoreductase subunit I
LPYKPVVTMRWTHSMENSECILCRSCVDVCPGGAINYSFSAGE